MDFWRLGLVLFKLCLCSESRGAGWSNSTAPAHSQWRMVRRGTDLAPICSDVQVKNIWLVACKVRTGRLRGGGEDCLIRHRDNQKSCEPRFSLHRRDQTVFLHLTALTPADSGLYQCRCVGGDQFHLNLHITVAGDISSITSVLPAASATSKSIFHFTGDVSNVNKTRVYMSALLDDICHVDNCKK